MGKVRRRRLRAAGDAGDAGYRPGDAGYRPGDAGYTPPTPATAIYLRSHENSSESANVRINTVDFNTI